MNTTLLIKSKTSLYGIAKALPSSKSISNRVLVLDALTNHRAVLHNLSDANDTQLMIRLIKSQDQIVDVEDAGTTMRFLTAYHAASGHARVMTGSARMKERPIGILVDALRELGVTITYEEKPGYPPIRIEGFPTQLTNTLRIRGDVSSQFISALMMIAPTLPQGLTLILEGKVGSRPYIDMTAALMQVFGVNCSSQENTIKINHQIYKPAEFTVESDWSAASYWFAFAAIARDAHILLPRIALNSLQGDRVIETLMQTLGVKAISEGSSLRLVKSSDQKEMKWDFTHCPDLAQTVAVVCAAKGVTGNFTGLESLRIKETDRISALQNELQKINASLIEETPSSWKLVPSSKLPDAVKINTYKDHRMAMAFAPLAATMDVSIENPDVVKKSYPRFWDDMRSMGFEISQAEH